MYQEKFYYICAWNIILITFKLYCYISYIRLTQLIRRLIKLNTTNLGRIKKRKKRKGSRKKRNKRKKIGKKEREKIFLKNKTTFYKNQNMIKLLLLHYCFGTFGFL